MEKKKVLLAIGEEHVTRILRDNMSETFDVLRDEVLHAQYISYYVETTAPDLLIVNERFLQHDTTTDEEREAFYLKLFQELREHYDDRVRIVFMCERGSLSDPFLAKLISVNVLDIFHKRKIDIQAFIHQLEEKPRYANVKKFLITQSVSPVLYDEEYDQEFEAEEITEEQGDEATLEAEAVEDDHQTISPQASTSEKKINKKKPSKEKQTKAKPSKTKAQDSKSPKGPKVVVKKEVVYEKKYVNIPSKTIGFVSLSPKSGASFFSLNFAKALADTGIDVSYLESPYHSAGKSFIYHQLGLHLDDQWEELNDHYSIPHLIHKESSIRDDNIYHKEGIHFFLHNPNLNPVDWNYDHHLNMLYHSKNKFSVVDLGYLRAEMRDIKRMLAVLDYVFIVVNPLPQEIDSNSHLLDVLFEDEHINAHYILNHFNEGINQKALPFDLKQVLQFPTLDFKEVCRSYYNCKIPYTNKQLKPIFDEHFDALAKVVESQITFSKKKKKSLLSKFKKRRDSK